MGTNGATFGAGFALNMKPGISSERHDVAGSFVFFFATLPWSIARGRDGLKQTASVAQACVSAGLSLIFRGFFRDKNWGDFGTVDGRTTFAGIPLGGAL